MDDPTDMDEAAMQRLAAGDDLALNGIMHRWQERIAAFLLRMTGDHTTACDLAQETFVRLYRGCTRYRAASTFRSYLFSIAANLARNHRRWRCRHPEEPLDGTGNDTPEPASDAAGPDELLVRQETARAVQRAVLGLPADLREALVLSTYHGLGHQEVAVITGCSPKAVEMRLYRARQLLKDRLQHLAPAPAPP